MESLKRSQRFPKTARLRKRAEFVKISRLGTRIQSANFVVIISANGKRENRLGITVSAKVSNAVNRNRLKRWIREYFRQHRAELPAGSDILIIARNSAGNLNGKLVTNELERFFAGQLRRWPPFLQT